MTTKDHEITYLHLLEQQLSDKFHSLNTILTMCEWQIRTAAWSRRITYLQLDIDSILCEIEEARANIEECEYEQSGVKSVASPS